MAIKGLTAALLLATASAAGQSLVSTVNNPFQVAASYGYSQTNHGGEWILIDVGIQSAEYGTMRLDRAFSLVMPDGVRLASPSQAEYREGLDEILKMHQRAAPMQLSPWLAIPDCKVHSFIGWSLVPGGGFHADNCRTWRLWGNGGIDWTATVGPSTAGGASLFFRSPTGEWPAGEYTLMVDGPGDMAARLPVRLH